MINILDFDQNPPDKQSGDTWEKWQLETGENGRGKSWDVESDSGELIGGTEETQRDRTKQIIR